MNNHRASGGFFIDGGKVVNVIHSLSTLSTVYKHSNENMSDVATFQSLLCQYESRRL